MKATPLLLLLLSVCQPSVHGHAFVTFSPSRSQYFEYEKVSVSCERLGPEWTVWRSTADGLKLSQCGSDWGDPTSSSCDLKTIKLSDSGVYWCESNHRDSSNTVNVTVTGGPVVLQSPVLPVMEGDNITLLCRTKTSSNLPADFYKDGVLIGTGPEGHMTVHHVNRSGEGFYKCTVSDGESPPSWIPVTADSEPVSLTLSPASSQLFEYEDVSLSCGHNSSFDGWTVFRFRTSANGSGGRMSRCGEDWGTPSAAGCDIVTSKQTDSATYWCESPAKQRSNALHIAVHDGPVVLQSPVLPVMQGDNITLVCRTKTSSTLPADFYKDGVLIGTGPEGHMTVHHVSRSDEGLYKCHISGDGESPPSWLFVRDPNGRPPSAADSTLLALTVMRHLVVIFPYCVSTVLLVSVCRHRPAGRNPAVSTATPPPSRDDEGLDQPYDDASDDVTTEHHF